MDTSKEYIKMCEKAIEIQKLEPAQYPENIGNLQKNQLVLIVKHLIMMNMPNIVLTIELYL